jgi:hypothetical protein
LFSFASNSISIGCKFRSVHQPDVTLAATLLFRKLRIVAGVWEAIAQNGLGAKDGDLAANVVRAYSLLALSQAEEVTLQMGLAKRSPTDYLSKVNTYPARCLF